MEQDLTQFAVLTRGMLQKNAEKCHYFHSFNANYIIYVHDPANLCWFERIIDGLGLYAYFSDSQNAAFLASGMMHVVSVQ